MTGNDTGNWVMAGQGTTLPKGLLAGDEILAVNGHEARAGTITQVLQNAGKWSNRTVRAP